MFNQYRKVQTVLSAKDLSFSPTMIVWTTAWTKHF